MYKNLIELFKENEGKGAVGAFNLHCFEMLPAMIQAAEELNVPIIIQTSLGTAEYIGFEPLIAAVKALAYATTSCVFLIFSSIGNADPSYITEEYPRSIAFFSASMLLQ